MKGDLTKGAHIKLIKFIAGSKTPPHTHSHSYTGFVVKGKARHYKPEAQTILSAGSSWTIPANVIHISECLEGSECIFTSHLDGAFYSKTID